ncbi:MAG TPA: hypothetical protein DCX07_09720 [Phycisphaerales bacterium]|nr:hypothetical protein [Phycisphaerales bacterium]
MAKKANRDRSGEKAAVVYPTCVRHARPRKDVKLRHFFLCDACTRQWVQEAFDGNEPCTYGDPVDGYCLLCNKVTSVRLQTWFLCDICERVARSIGRNHVAEKAIMDFWAEKIRPKCPHLAIAQNDVSSLRPRRSDDVSGEGPLDFLVTDEETGQTVFGIENKTGRSSIKDMSQFQLDVSDCDSILHHVRELNIPAYIIHAQVLEMWQPPTMGFHAVGLWWSDIYRMTENFVSVKMRRMENRGAAYFKRAAFAPISTFGDELYDEGGQLRLIQRFRAEGIPQMYVSE